MENMTIARRGDIPWTEDWPAGVADAGGGVLTEMLAAAPPCGQAGDPCGPNLPACCQGLYCANDTHKCIQGG